MTISPPQRNLFSIMMHWLTLLLLIVLTASVFLREDLEGKSLKLLLLNAHRSLGLLVLIIAVPRFLLWIKYEISHQKISPSHFWLRFSATAAHLAIFALLFVLPVLGWMASNARGQTVSLFGLVNFPTLTVLDTDYADDLVHYHELGAWLIMGLVVMHVGAALWHHFVRRDDVMSNMLLRKEKM